jgi:serine/threonine protein kinase
VLIVAHRKGILHRDLKPSNLFLTREGQVKVLDFGLARAALSAGGDGLITWSGLAMGTPAFMSPEQARGHVRAVDARSDIWGCGATLFTLLSGQHVHFAETSQEQLGMAMIAAPRSLRLAKPDLARETIRWIDRALEFEPDDRWQSAGEMLAAIPQALRRVGTSMPQTPVSSARMLAPVPEETGTLTGFGRNAPRATTTTARVKTPHPIVWLALVVVTVSCAAFFFSQRKPRTIDARIAVPPHTGASRASLGPKPRATTIRTVDVAPAHREPVLPGLKTPVPRPLAPTRSSRPTEPPASLEPPPLTGAHSKSPPLDRPELLDRR